MLLAFVQYYWLYYLSLPHIHIFCVLSINPNPGETNISSIVIIIPVQLSGVVAHRGGCSKCCNCYVSCRQQDEGPRWLLCVHLDSTVHLIAIRGISRPSKNVKTTRLYQRKANINPQVGDACEKWRFRHSFRGQ